MAQNVAIVPEDVNFTVSQNDEGVIGGTVSGFTFTGNEDSGLGTVNITAFLEANPQVSTVLSVHLIAEADAPEISPVPPVPALTLALPRICMIRPENFRTG